jgi:hypothetical protein
LEWWKLNLIEKIIEVAGGCTVVPDSVWFHKDLKPIDVKLYKVLLDYGKIVFGLEHGKTTLDEYPIIDVAQVTLAEKVGVSDKTIQTSQERLRKVGLIKIDGNRGYKRNNHIILVGDFFGITPESLEENDRRLKVVEKEIKRVPIKRVPIILPKTSRYEDKLREMGGMTYTEKAIIAVAKHYEMLASRFNHIGGYRSLSKRDPQKHKNWPYFEKLFNLCRDKGWDANLYLEAQFERARKYWKDSRIKYPLPKMLCSEKAQEFFVRYLKDRQEKYSKEARHVNLGAKKTESMKTLLMREIIETTKYLKMYVRDDVEPQGRQEDKAIRLFHAWESYAPAYLWTVPWFHEFIREKELDHPENEKIKSVIAVFDMINRSKKLQEVVKKTVEVVEREYGLPNNIAL